MVQRLQECDPIRWNINYRGGKRDNKEKWHNHWEVNSLVLLDQMRRQEKAISFEDVNQQGELRGFGYNIDAQPMEI